MDNQSSLLELAASLDLRLHRKTEYTFSALVEDYVGHNEPKLALEFLIDRICEEDFSITVDELETLKSLRHLLNVEGRSGAWAYLEQLVIV